MNAKILTPFFVIILILSVFIPGCEKKKEMETVEFSRQEGVAHETDVPTIKPKPINYDSMFVVISQITAALKNEPTDINLRQELVSAGYDTAWETIMAVGFGEASSRASTESISEKFLQQAAAADAYRWAAYIKRWHENPAMPEFGAISTTIGGGKIVLQKRLSEDNFSVLIEVKSSKIQ